MTVDDSLSLENAKKLIFANSCPCTEEIIPIGESLSRRPFTDLHARIPVPHFRQSTMDGYGICSKNIKGAQPPLTLPVIGEIAAGCTMIPRIKTGGVFRIMTGGTVPPTVDQIIPAEWCRERDESVTIFKFGGSGQYIRPIGTDLRKGGLILRRGECITPFHLHLLATSGLFNVKVFSRPKISFLCTGSELVEEKPLQGQIISGNLAMLDGLIRLAGGIPLSLGRIIDDTDKITEQLHNALPADIMITTGGMGPGKYDLMGQALEKTGVKILYHSLQVRPGRSTIFGAKDETLFFCLPGPPPAVHLLFNELVRPAILAMQGKRYSPVKTRAILTKNMVIKKKGLLNLKSGITATHSGMLTVRPAGLTEAADATIVIPANRRRLRNGEKVKIHLYR